MNEIIRNHKQTKSISIKSKLSQEEIDDLRAQMYELEYQKEELIQLQEENQKEYKSQIKDMQKQVDDLILENRHLSGRIPNIISRKKRNVS